MALRECEKQRRTLGVPVAGSTPKMQARCKMVVADIVGTAAPAPAQKTR
jgi:hypothetical protein